MIVAGGDKIY